MDVRHPHQERFPTFGTLPRNLIRWLLPIFFVLTIVSSLSALDFDLAIDSDPGRVSVPTSSSSYVTRWQLVDISETRVKWRTSIADALVPEYGFDTGDSNVPTSSFINETRPPSIEGGKWRFEYLRFDSEGNTDVTSGITLNAACWIWEAVPTSINAPAQSSLLGAVEINRLLTKQRSSRKIRMLLKLQRGVLVTALTNMARSADFSGGFLETGPPAGGPREGYWDLIEASDSTVKWRTSASQDLDYFARVFEGSYIPRERFKMETNPPNLEGGEWRLTYRRYDIDYLDRLGSKFGQNFAIFWKWDRYPDEIKREVSRTVEQSLRLNSRISKSKESKKRKRLLRKQRAILML